MNKRFATLGNIVSGRSLAVLAASALPVMAFAQAAADPFDAAIATATTKVAAYSAALVTLAAVGVVFLIAIKYVKRIPRAS
jgi:hypothetical protein